MVPKNIDQDFDFLPIWAERFSFKNHSPSAASRPTGKEMFEKVIARPAKLYDFAGCPATGGKVCEEYARQVVVDGVAAGEAFRHCVSTFDEHRCLEHQPDDAIKHAMIRDAVYTVPKSDPEETGTILELTASHTAEGLREATAGANIVTDGRWISSKLETNDLHHIGEMDFEAHGGEVEVKTRWITLTTSERGYTVRSLPKRPDPAHVQQVALYWHWLRQQSDNVPVSLIYANCIGYRIFTSADCDDLSPAKLNEALERLARIARVRENILKAATTVEELFGLVDPQFDHWMWNNVPPAYRAAAEQQWGI